MRYRFWQVNTANGIFYGWFCCFIGFIIEMMPGIACLKCYWPPMLSPGLLRSILFTH